MAPHDNENSAIYGLFSAIQDTLSGAFAYPEESDLNKKSDDKPYDLSRALTESTAIYRHESASFGSSPQKFSFMEDDSSVGYEEDFVEQDSVSGAYSNAPYAPFAYPKGLARDYSETPEKKFDEFLEDWELEFDVTKKGRSNLRLTNNTGFKESKRLNIDPLPDYVRFSRENTFHAILGRRGYTKEEKANSWIGRKHIAAYKKERREVIKEYEQLIDEGVKKISKVSFRGCERYTVKGVKKYRARRAVLNARVKDFKTMSDEEKNAFFSKNTKDSTEQALEQGLWDEEYMKKQTSPTFFQLDFNFFTSKHKSSPVINKKRIPGGILKHATDAASATPQQELSGRGRSSKGTSNRDSHGSCRHAETEIRRKRSVSRGRHVKDVAEAIGRASRRLVCESTDYTSTTQQRKSSGRGRASNGASSRDSYGAYRQTETEIKRKRSVSRGRQAKGAAETEIRRKRSVSRGRPAKNVAEAVGRASRRLICESRRH